jgi:DNA-directed RNA polymerase II subunit RPB3
VATYKYEPIITINQAVMNMLSPEQKAELYKSCPTEVYETDENFEQLTVGDANRCMYCDECIKVANAFKDNPEDDAAVSVRMREDKFIFSVEVSSSALLDGYGLESLLTNCFINLQTTGQLRPEEVVICALDIIREKLLSLKHQCLELNHDDHHGDATPITPFG